MALTEIDDLFGHEPVSTRTRELLNRYVADSLVQSRYDFRMGGKMPAILEQLGMELLCDFTVPDSELSFSGRASSDVLEAWRTRFDRMRLLRDYRIRRRPRRFLELPVARPSRMWSNGAMCYCHEGQVMKANEKCSADKSTPLLRRKDPKALALGGWYASAKPLVPQAAFLVGSSQAFLWFWSLMKLGWLKRPGLTSLAAVIGVVLAISVGYDTLNGYAENTRIAREELIHSHRWCTYDSIYYWPADVAEEVGREAQEPTEHQIRAELTQLRELGFDGLILNECRSVNLQIVQIARDLGFGAIIQGIRVGNTKAFSSKPVAELVDISKSAEDQAAEAADIERVREEIERSIRMAPYVDGYFLGEFRARDVDMRDLKRVLARIRKETNRLTTSSFLSSDYEGVCGDRLRELEDFVVQSLDLPWSDDMETRDPTVAINALQKAIQETKKHDKPTLIQTVWYPSAGDGFDEKEQQEYSNSCPAFSMEPAKRRSHRGFRNHRHALEASVGGGTK